MATFFVLSMVVCGVLAIIDLLQNMLALETSSSMPDMVIRKVLLGMGIKLLALPAFAYLAVTVQGGATDRSWLTIVSCLMVAVWVITARWTAGLTSRYQQAPWSQLDEHSRH